MTWFRPADPRTGQPTPDYFPEATDEEITLAIEHALEATPVLAGFTSEQRASALRRLAEQLERQESKLTAQADIETGLGQAHVVAELADCCRRLRHLADAVASGADVGANLRSTQRGTAWSRTMWVPRGPVVVFEPASSPFVFGIPGSDVTSALAAGCAVIAKSSPGHPATAEACAAIIDGTLRALGWPVGAHALVHGAHTTVAEDLVAAPGVAAVGFAGAHDVGRPLFDLASARPEPIPFFASFGSLNPLFVSAGAGREVSLAHHIAESVTYAGGQSCMRPGMVVIDRSGSEQFVATLANRLRDVGGQPMLTADTHAAFATAVASRVELAGVTPLTDRVIETGGGYKQQPVLLEVDADDFLAQPLLAEECFGPLLVVVRGAPEQFNEIVAALPGSLIAGMYVDSSDDPEVWRELGAALALRVGRVLVNQPPAMPEPGSHAAHTGPWPVTTGIGQSALGAEAIRRWQRIVSFEGAPNLVMPQPLQDDNPWGITRIVDGSPTRDPVGSIVR